MPKKKTSGSWKKGQSGNPSGYSKERHLQRASIREALASGLIKGNKNKLVDCIVAGVEEGDAQFARMALEYLYGKPEQRLAVRKIEELTDTEFKQLTQRALFYVHDGKDDKAA